MTNRRYLTQLRQKLIALFDQAEAQSLCQDLGVDYESLPAVGKADKIRALVEELARKDGIPRLVELCQEERPAEIWTYQARLFIADKRKAAVDAALATHLHQTLTQAGHIVFIDQGMRAGDAWLEQISQEIKEADYLIVLLSNESDSSEMMRSELKRAYDFRQLRGHPHILPVRIRYQGLLPFAIDAFLSPIHYVTWESEDDTPGLVQEILTAIEAGELAQKEPVTAAPTGEQQHLSEDGRLVARPEKAAAPSPEFDPRLLKRLTAPTGALRLRDTFYVERPEDQRLKQEIVQWGSTITIRAPRQSGKTSLLMRGIHHASQAGARVVFLDLQGLGQDQLASPDSLLRELASTFCYELRLDPEMAEEAWQDPVSPPRKMTYFLEDHILPAFDVPVVLAIDEADSLLQTPYYQDFFGLLRSWHNRRARNEAWEKLNLVLVISTEPYLLIEDLTQSPFNVGLPLKLADFTPKLVGRLNVQHGSPLNPVQLAEAVELVHGQPYLTRKLFYVLVEQGLSWEELLASATDDDGPFGDHLRGLYWELQDQPDLKSALRQIVRTQTSRDDKALHRLLRAGLVTGSGDAYRCRCPLYQGYFENKLG